VRQLRLKYESSIRNMRVSDEKEYSPKELEGIEDGKERCYRNMP
jgi:hypothetical protein